MPLDIGLWRVDGQVRRLPVAGMPNEERLEDLVEADPAILGQRLHLVLRDACLVSRRRAAVESLERRVAAGSAADAATRRRPARRELGSRCRLGRPRRACLRHGVVGDDAGGLLPPRAAPRAIRPDGSRAVSDRPSRRRSSAPATRAAVALCPPCRARSTVEPRKV